MLYYYHTKITVLSRYTPYKYPLSTPAYKCVLYCKATMTQNDFYRRHQKIPIALHCLTLCCDLNE